MHVCMYTHTCMIIIIICSSRRSLAGEGQGKGEGEGRRQEGLTIYYNVISHIIIYCTTMCQWPPPRSRPWRSPPAGGAAATRRARHTWGRVRDSMLLCFMCLCLVVCYVVCVMLTCSVNPLCLCLVYGIFCFGAGLGNRLNAGVS